MESWTIIILGATGDLSRTRLIPSLYKLFEHRGDSFSFAFIGAAKDVITSDKLIEESVQTDNNDLLARFKKLFSYNVIEFASDEDFQKLAEQVREVEKKHNLSGNRLIYLSVPADWYCRITQKLVTHGIAQNQKALAGVHHRIVYEKPFGWNAQSAQDINTCITQLLEEDQLYRVDHYLTKSLIMSLLLMRWSNAVFEPVWNGTFIDQVQIILSEETTIKERGSFYDRYGALKDVVQNHLLQLIAYIAMEHPEVLDAQSLSEHKNMILKNLVVDDGLLGQYEGYPQERDVPPDSKTETYALLRFQLTLPRWQGVPFYAKTGKALHQKGSEIHIVFKPVSKKIVNEPGLFDANRLIIHISPQASFTLQTNIQKGFEHNICPMKMDFFYRNICEYYQPHSYETLLHEILLGSQSIAVSPQEIYHAWDIIDQIESLKLPLYTYKVGTSGPDEAEAFTKKYGINWLKPPDNDKD